MSGWQPPRKPGDRFATVDMVPEEAANDMEFQRAVQQLEEQQSHRTGWLFASGAFDKGDQAFMRAQQEATHHAEEAQLDRERSEFLAARARAEEEALERAAASKAAAAKGQLEGERRKRRPLVRIKHAGSDPEAETKRARQLSPGLESEPPIAQDHGGGEAPAAEQAQQGVGEAEQDEEEGLGGLLGAYGSDSDPGSEKEPDAPAAAPASAAAAAAKATPLPSAAELFGS